MSDGNADYRDADSAKKGVIMEVPERVTCPACRKKITLTVQSNLRQHGHPAKRCPGWAASLGFRYRVVDSSIDKVPIGTHLIYANYRGEFDQQDMLIEYKPAGGWAMEFLDAGMKYKGKWYDFDGRTEAA